jgi:tRNA(fMet)-specific endonuclease VapC
VRYLLDTNTCIRVLTNRGTTLVERWKRTQPSQIRLCSVVKAELLFGAEKSSKRELAQQKLLLFFSRFKSIPFDDRAAHTYGIIRVALEKEGQPIGPNDMLIAAIALANGLTVVTHNTTEFSRVSGLLVEDWET